MSVSCLCVEVHYSLVWEVKERVGLKKAAASWMTVCPGLAGWLESTTDGDVQWLLGCRWSVCTALSLPVGHLVVEEAWERLFCFSA